MTLKELDALKEKKFNPDEMQKDSEYLYQAAKLAITIKEFFADELYAKVFIMHYCALMTRKEISLVMKMSAENVKNIIDCGRNRIRNANREKLCAK